MNEVGATMYRMRGNAKLGGTVHNESADAVYNMW